MSLAVEVSKDIFMEKYLLNLFRRGMCLFFYWLHISVNSFLSSIRQRCLLRKTFITALFTHDRTVAERGGAQEGGAALLENRGELKNDGIEKKVFSFSSQAASLMEFKTCFGIEVLIDGHGERDTSTDIFSSISLFTLLDRELGLSFISCLQMLYVKCFSGFLFFFRVSSTT